jgi:hypothetical protein
MTAVQVVARRGRYEGQVTHARWQGAIAGRGREGLKAPSLDVDVKAPKALPLDVDVKTPKAPRWTLMRRHVSAIAGR